MDRYKFEIRSGHQFDVVDTKFGITPVATFRTMEMAQKFIEYINLCERMSNLLVKHINADIETEFADA